MLLFIYVLVKTETILMHLLKMYHLIKIICELSSTVINFFSVLLFKEFLLRHAKKKQSNYFIFGIKQQRYGQSISVNKMLMPLVLVNFLNSGALGAASCLAATSS